jgi:hypothetical protein
METGMSTLREGGLFASFHHTYDVKGCFLSHLCIANLNIHISHPVSFVLASTKAKFLSCDSSVCISMLGSLSVHGTTTNIKLPSQPTTFPDLQHRSSSET